MLLKIENASVHYDSVVAVRDVTIEVTENSTVTIIGANGAGKTTLLRAISGLNKLRTGGIRFNDEPIDALPPEKIIALGIAHVPEGRRVFPELTVSENLRLGAYLRRDATAVEKDLNDIYGRFPRLRERTKQRAKTLSGGEQQMLAMGRALMSSPRLLLLDEPSMGLSPVMVEEIAGIIQDVRQRGVAVILVEQNAEMALQLSDYGYVLETGSVALQGSGDFLRGNKHVQKAYLGG